MGRYHCAAYCIEKTTLSPTLKCWAGISGHLNATSWWFYIQSPSSSSVCVLSLACFECSLGCIWLTLPQSLSPFSSHFWLVMCLAEKAVSWIPVCWIMRVMHITSCCFFTLPFNGSLLYIQSESHCMKDAIFNWCQRTRQFHLLLG